jgi:hypothetical protein
MKLLKASVKNKSRKIAKLESRLIQLELEKKDDTIEFTDMTPQERFLYRRTVPKPNSGH